MQKRARSVFSLFVIATALSPISSGASEEKFRYHYVSLDEALPPDVLFIFPAALLADGRVVGTGWSCGPETCTPSTLIYQNGKMTAVGKAIAYSANDSGLIGGSILIDPDNGIEQAALLRTGRPPQLLPRAPDEYTSHVRKVTDSGAAFVEYFDSNFRKHYYSYDNGRSVPLNLGPDFVDHVTANNRGLVSGTVIVDGQKNDRAFRYDPRTNVITKLGPLPTENDSWGQAINSRGDVLGYSQIYSGLERIGVWRGQTFQTYFVEGTPQFPTISNRLRWNEAGLIVITNTEEPDLGSYLVPRPGTRLALKDLTDAPLPPWTEVVDINERGDLIGSGGPSRFFIEHNFLLKRASNTTGAAPIGAAASLGKKANLPSKKLCPRAAKTLPEAIKAWCGF